MILYVRLCTTVEDLITRMPPPIRAIAIIPARGGSKRIPGKNIKAFNGRPIISYSIAAALKAACFAEVMVSTDDDDIASVARASGATVPFLRSPENSNDFAGLAEVCREVLDQYQKIGQSFDLLCCILPTAPFITAERIKQGYDLLMSSDADSVVPVTSFGYPVQRAVKLDESGQLSMIWPENYNVRSQDLPASYHDAGQFYWSKSQSLLDQMRFFAEKSVALVLPQIEVQDIDSLEDWELAEMKYKLMHLPKTQVC
jgi:pseudaminic acid cytidylyltransferase